jgi:hypothetical protein
MQEVDFGAFCSPRAGNYQLERPPCPTIAEIPSHHRGFCLGGVEIKRLKTFYTGASSPPKPTSTTMRPFLLLCALQFSVIPSALAFAPQLLPTTRAINAQVRDSGLHDA